MAYYRVRPSGRPINRLHPFAERAGEVWTPDNETTFRGHVNSLDGTPAFATGVPTVARDVGAYGPCTLWNGSSSQATLPDSPLLRPGQSFTLAAVFQIFASGTIYPGLISRFGAFDYPAAHYTLNFTSTTQKLAFGAAGSVYDSANLLAQANKWCVAVGVNAPAGATLYLDEQDETTTAFAAPTYGGEVATIGALVNGTGAGLGQFPGRIALVTLQNWSWTANDVARFARDPFEMFRPRPPAFFMAIPPPPPPPTALASGPDWRTTTTAAVNPPRPDWRRTATE